jgi:hypothetical protein
VPEPNEEKLKEDEFLGSDKVDSEDLAVVESCSLPQLPSRFCC